WYGWDGDRLTTIQTGTTRIQTVYQPGSFTPLLRIETENGEQAKARHRSLAEVLQEDTGVTLPAELAVMLGRLERELRAGAVSAESEAWLAQCGLTAEQMAAQMEAEYIPERKLHLYHCDHRGLPQALISPEGETAWCGEYDEWGNLLGETSAQHLQQSLRLPGQQYDEESGLYYNRNRYYDPLQGRYITQDPIGLKGGWNLYAYPLNPVQRGDPLGLSGETLVLGSATTVTGTKFGGALLSGGAATFDAVTTAMASAAPALGAMAVVAGPMGYDLLANDGRAGKALSDGQLINSQAEMCYWTSSCPLDSPHENDNSSGSQPNVGKDLTDEEKNCLAGGSTGSPGGWGPEDEDNARNQERGFDIEELPDAHGKMHDTAVKGDARIPRDKVDLYMRGKASGNLDELQQEYDELINLRRDNQRAFAKEYPDGKKTIRALEDKMHNIDRSREMGQILEDAGIPDTPANNDMIIEKLLDSAQGDLPADRTTSVVIDGKNGSVRVNGVWVDMPDGAKRLSTIIVKVFK
ncbi:TPA: RHS repeat-associated core domain-containing protein, partial [Escherichia coli]